jgi:hypothetical protein
MKYNTIQYNVGTRKPTTLKYSLSQKKTLKYILAPYKYQNEFNNHVTTITYNQILPSTTLIW